MSSSAYSLSAAIPAEAFEVVEGEPVIGGLHGPHRHYFCARCMTWMFTRPAGFDAFVNIRPTMIDGRAWAEPFIETCTRERLPGAETTAPRAFETFPDPSAFEDLMAAYADWARK